MLLFIVDTGTNLVKKFKFQYISCYCLSDDFTYTPPVSGISIHLMLLFIATAESYTSFIPQFQYISCYCLSEFLLFWTTLKDISIHLMLLFILLILYHKVKHIYFNTSHVTVYHRKTKKESYTTKISIHLMLLFIKIQLLAQGNVEHFNTSHVTVYHPKCNYGESAGIFQYISCYCLSFYTACNNR